jgi:transcriptional regulator with XRE-family HTH domain
VKTKSFKTYIEKRLDKDEIAEIEKQAQLEVAILKTLRDIISGTMNDYMEKNNVGFNELVRRLDASPSHVAKIQNGSANLTLSSLAHLLALMGKDPKDIFKIKK